MRFGEAVPSPRVKTRSYEESTSLRLGRVFEGSEPPALHRRSYRSRLLTGRKLRFCNHVARWNLHFARGENGQLFKAIS